MVKIKSGVEPRSLYILAAVANVARLQALPFDVTITAGRNGQHMPGSMHGHDRALDVRSKNFPSREAKALFLSLVLKRLGPGYQGLLEAEGTANEHFHIEYDPT